MQVYLDPGAHAPTRAHPTDAGLDIRIMADAVVPARGSIALRTGVHVRIPPDCAGILISKSGLNVRHDITSTGLIDEQFSGAITVKLYNHGDKDYELKAGDKISQLCIVPVCYVPVEIVDELWEPEGRGMNGIGSTGR